MNTVKSYKSNPLYTANQINIHLTEKQTVDATLDALSSAYQPLDKFSMWLLGFSGAYAALIISNAQIFEILKTSSYWFYVEIGALLTSSLCGFFAKFFCTLRIEVERNSTKLILKNLRPIYDQHFQRADQIENLDNTINTNINFYRISKQIAKSFPKCLQKIVLRNEIKAFRRNQQLYTTCIPKLVWLAILIGFQALTLVVAVLSLILCIALNSNTFLTNVPWHRVFY